MALVCTKEKEGRNVSISPDGKRIEILDGGFERRSFNISDAMFFMPSDICPGCHRGTENCPALRLAYHELMRLSRQASSVPAQ